jgi:hypothetical protein
MTMSGNLDDDAAVGAASSAGDFVISDSDLEGMKNDDARRRKGLNLQRKPSDASWEIVRDRDDYDDGSFALTATTKGVIRGVDANAVRITTYHGTAEMGISVVAGPMGGTLHYAIFSDVHAPIDVLEIILDDVPIMAVTSPTSDWEGLILEVSPGEHEVVFRHVSNPSFMSISELEAMGRPGSSKIDGLRYVDSFDPNLTLEPTLSPTTDSEESTPRPSPEPEPPSPAPTPAAAPAASNTIQAQNYCSTSQTLIKETCYTADPPLTCNEGDGPCPEGTFCYGNVVCVTPEENDITQEIIELSHGPANEDENEVVEEEDDEESPQADELESSPIVAIQDEDEGVAKEDEDESPKANEIGCPEGLLAAEGLPGCCVPDLSFLGDGACDPDSPFNTAECGYDLGDCCRESCNTDTHFGCKAKEGDEFGPFGFYCIDPLYTNIEVDDCIAENREWIGDGGCDPEYNTKPCGWDGGDCCKETCDSEFSYYECGREMKPFDCKDPDIIYMADYVP